jgi:hypothetical protein
VSKLIRDTYQPRASTPLIDAAYKTIEAVEASLAAKPAEKVVICIQTDGQENASTEHNWDDLNAMVKAKASEGWQFNFMGVGIDAYHQGARMGIAPAATVAYDHRDPQATRAVFAASAANARDYASGIRPSSAYCATQKRSAGDPFAKLFKSEAKQDNVAKKDVKPEKQAKRELKKAIVDDINF